MKPEILICCFYFYFLGKFSVSKKADNLVNRKWVQFKSVPKKPYTDQIGVSCWDSEYYIEPENIIMLSPLSASDVPK